MNILQQIYDYKKEELEHFKRVVRFEELRDQCRDLPSPVSFLKIFKQNNPALKIIAEVKQKSPSKGILRENFDPVAIAKSYEQNGAVAISVLTDEHFFGGNLEYLRQIKQHVKIPLLRKDFIWDDYQIYEAAQAGASAILLIATMLGEQQLQDLQGRAEELQMHALVELYDPLELNKAQDAKILGVNNRNLKTFAVDLGQTQKVLELLPKGFPLVSESGLENHQQLLALHQQGVAGFLIGESLVVKPDPGIALKQLLQGS